MHLELLDIINPSHNSRRIYTLNCYDITHSLVDKKFWDVIAFFHNYRRIYTLNCYDITTFLQSRRFYFDLLRRNRFP